MKRPSDAEPFLRRLLPTLHEVFGPVGYFRIGNDIRVRVELDNVDNHAGRWRGFRIEVIHVDRGRLDAVFLAFDDMLRGVARTDNRKDHEGGFEVITHVAADWYIAKPADEAPIAATVKRYMKLWDNGHLPARSRS